MDESAPERPWVRSACHAILAAAFLAWWLPQDMGVRPEGVVCVCAGARRMLRRAGGVRAASGWPWRGSRSPLAGLGFAAHPTGFTLLAPLLAGLPLLWRAGRGARRPGGTALRALAVASGGMVAPLLAFVDGGLRDFLRGQAIFLSIQAQESWATEIQRYDFLLTQIPMGNYAKRTAVLVCLVALVWFAVLAAAARMRRVPLPMALWFAGVHHRAGLRRAVAHPVEVEPPLRRAGRASAPAFLALFLALAVPTVRSVLDMKRLPYGVVAAAAGSFVRGDRAGLARSQPVAVRLAGRRAQARVPARDQAACVLDSPLLWLLRPGRRGGRPDGADPDGRHARRRG